jgi:hypothetical protein
MIDRLMRKVSVKPLIAGICVSAEQADTVRYSLPDESFKGKPVSLFDNAGNHVPLALERAHYRSFSSVTAPTLAAFLVPMPVLIASADIGFINLNDPAKLLNVLNHGSSDLVAHKPSSLVGAEAHIPEYLEGAHALLADQHHARDSVPVFQRLIGVLKDCAGQVREAITCGATGGAHGALPMVAGSERVDLGVAATRAVNALRPAAGHQVHNAIVLSLKQRVELGRCHLMDCFRAGHANSPSMVETFA